MNNKSNAELVTLLTNPELKEVAGLHLLQQMPSVDNDILIRIIECTNHKYTAWERLKMRYPTCWQLERLIDTDLMQEAWELLLEVARRNKDLHPIVKYKARMRDIAAAELLKRNPDQEDLLCVVGYSGLWEIAWAELLKRGITNSDLAYLIDFTPFRQLPWEQLKKQSPTANDLYSVLPIEEESTDPLLAEIGAYMLTLEPDNHDLVALIKFVPGVREQAIDRLLQQSPNEREIATIKEFRTIEIIPTELSRSQLIEKICEYDRPKERWELLLKQSPTREELMRLVNYSQFRELPAELLLQQELSNKELVDIIMRSKQHKMAGWKRLLAQSPTQKNLKWILWVEGMEDLAAVELLKRTDVENEMLVDIIRNSQYKDQAWETLKNRKGAENAWLSVLLYTGYDEPVWQHWNMKDMAVDVLVALIMHDEKKQEAVAELRLRLDLQPEDEQALKLRIATKILDEKGKLLEGEVHHEGDAHTLAGWVVTLSDQGKKIEAEHDTITAACALAPSMTELYKLHSVIYDTVRKALVRVKLGLQD